MRRQLLPLAALALLASSTACAPKSPLELGRHFTIAGVVYDGSTIATGGGNTGPSGSGTVGDPLKDVIVTLVSSDRFPSTKTDAHGSFIFTNVTQGDGMILIFELTGYAPVTRAVTDLIPDSSTSDGGCTICGPDGRLVTVTMNKRAAGGAVTGRVVHNQGGQKVLAGATVTLISSDNLPAASTDANGFFTFTGVKQLTNLRYTVALAGYFTFYSGAFNINPQNTGALPDGTAATPFFDTGDIGLTPQLVFTGVVSDAANRLPIAGVSVKLTTPDEVAAVTTDSNGVYRLTTITQASNGVANGNFSLTFSKAGYSTDIYSGFNVATCGNVTGANGLTFPTCNYNETMARAQGTLAGIVRFNTAPAAGAIIQLCVNGTACDGTNLLSQQTLPAAGTFSFADLLVNNSYRLRVLPWDQAPADGIYDTVLFNQDGYSPGSGNDATSTNIAIFLAGPAKSIIATSLAPASGQYPWTIGVNQSGLLQDPNATFFIQFGAPVDSALTSFELHQIEPGGRVSPPLAFTATWDRNIIANLKPAAPFQSFAETQASYQIWITSLRFGDGTVSIAPQPTANNAPAGSMVISFSVYKLPTLLANPTPALYFGNTSRQIRGVVRTGTSAVFDNDKVYVLDKNNDIVDFGAAGNGGAFWTSTGGQGIDLSWTAVDGAVSYTVWAHNTTSTGASNGHDLLWVPLTTVTGPADPVLNKTVVAANLSPWAALTSNPPGTPWAFSNAVEFAVTCTDRFGFSSQIDPTKVLSTKDTWGGQVSAVNADTGTGSGAFAAVLERGNYVTKVVSVQFTEPMSGQTLSATPPTPTLAVSSGAMTLVKTNATAYGTTGGPSANAPNTGDTAWFNLQLSANFVPCTEVLTSRVGGDILVPVRDSSIFAQNNKVVLLTPGTNSAVSFAEGQVQAVGPNVVTLQAAMVRQGSTTAANSGFTSNTTADVLCNLSAHGAAAMTNSTQYANGAIPTGTDPRVINLAPGTAAGFFIGERVTVYEPSIATGTANAVPALIDVRTVIGVDTAANLIVVDSNLTTGNSTTAPAPPATNGHTTASVVIPSGLLATAAADAEIRLRSVFDINGNITLNKDLPTGGVGSQLSIFPPGAAGYGGAGLPLVVGDKLLLDNDGDISTTTDQFVVTVSAIKCVPLFPANQPPNPSNATCVITADTLAGVSLTTTRSLVYALGDSFTVAGTADSSGNASLNTHGARFSAPGGPITRY